MGVRSWFKTDVTINGRLFKDAINHGTAVNKRERSTASSF